MSHILSARGGYGSGRVFPGPVTLRAGNLGDSLTGSDFADLLIGGNGPDFMHGSSGDDVIRGANGNDKLRGADGNDSIFGGQGADTFSGSYGDDVFDAHDGDADVQLNGGPGVDTAALRGCAEPDAPGRGDVQCRRLSGAKRGGDGVRPGVVRTERGRDRVVRKACSRESDHADGERESEGVCDHESPSFRGWEAARQRQGEWPRLPREPRF
jgi:hypothetical protein